MSELAGCPPGRGISASSSTELPIETTSCMVSAVSAACDTDLGDCVEELAGRTGWANSACTGAFSGREPVSPQ